MSSFKNFVKEGILDPIKKDLEPTVWKDGRLDSDIKSFIVSTFYQWLKENDIDKSKVKSINLLGSIADFQYGENSDFDVNVVMDMTEEELKPLRKELPNGQSPDGIEYPVNFFVVDEWQESWEDETNGIYDVLKDKWMKEPEQPKSDPFDSYKAVEDTGRFFVAGITNVLAEYKADVDAYNSFKEYAENPDSDEKEEEIKQSLKFKVQEIIDDIDSLKIAKHIIKQLRDEAFDSESLTLKRKTDSVKGNDSLNNLLYKFIERLGYFVKIDSVVSQKDKWIKEKNLWN